MYPLCLDKGLHDCQVSVCYPLGHGLMLNLDLAYALIISVRVKLVCSDTIGSCILHNKLLYIPIVN